MIINKQGFWMNPTKEGHAYDSRLAGAILKMLKARKCDTLVDFGCGTGEYARFFRRHGMVVEAYDGNPYTEQLTGGIGHVIDLSQPFDLHKQFKCVMSLEVGEHIPQEHEQLFIDNLVKHSIDGGIIILSWAVPGQSGDGHVNCQTNDYIMQQMQQRGFYLDNTLTNQLRKSASLWWFKNSLMVFI
jgi:cyclopropane fatty-acyl-phospholipid synthase-like methyltransferase